MNAHDALDARHEMLFESVTIGLVTAPHRYHQMSHCNGMGRSYASSMVEMQDLKARATGVSSAPRRWRSTPLRDSAR